MIRSSGILSLIDSIDGLYRSVVDDPAGWDEPAFAGWFEEVGTMFEGPIDRSIAREIRRAVRAARKLQRFCTSGSIFDGGDWRSVVDQALGSTAWVPSLDIARAGLQTDPTSELFTEVKNRFAVVHFTPWMEGIPFEEWLASREP